MSEFNFKQITGYSLEVNGLKQERTTHRYLRSFSRYRNDHRRMGRGSGKGGGGLQPPQHLGNLDFLGSKRNLGKADF